MNVLEYQLSIFSSMFEMSCFAILKWELTLEESDPRNFMVIKLSMIPNWSRNNVFLVSKENWPSDLEWVILKRRTAHQQWGLSAHICCWTQCQCYWFRQCSKQKAYYPRHMFWHAPQYFPTSCWTFHYQVSVAKRWQISLQKGVFGKFGLEKNDMDGWWPNNIEILTLLNFCGSRTRIRRKSSTVTTFAWISFLWSAPSFAIRSNLQTSSCKAGG